MLFLDLGDVLRATGHDVGAREAHEAALMLAGELQDLLGQAEARQRLGGGSPPPSSRGQQEPRQWNDTTDFEVTTHDEVMIDYVFDTDLLVDGPRQRLVTQWTEDTDPRADTVRPMLLPSARTWMDDEGAIRFSLLQGEPIVERHPGFTLLRRIRQELAISGQPAVLWRVISAMDGIHTVAEILSDVRPTSGRWLPALAAPPPARSMCPDGPRLVPSYGYEEGRLPPAAWREEVLPSRQMGTTAPTRRRADTVSLSVPARLHAFHTPTRASLPSGLPRSRPATKRFRRAPSAPRARPDRCRGRGEK
jgi:hypothetical protein